MFCHRLSISLFVLHRDCNLIIAKVQIPWEVVLYRAIYLSLYPCQWLWFIVAMFWPGTKFCVWPHKWEDIVIYIIMAHSNKIMIYSLTEQKIQHFMKMIVKSLFFGFDIKLYQKIIVNKFMNIFLKL